MKSWIKLWSNGGQIAVESKFNRGQVVVIAAALDMEKLRAVDTGRWREFTYRKETKTAQPQEFADTVPIGPESAGPAARAYSALLRPPAGFYDQKRRKERERREKTEAVNDRKKREGKRWMGKAAHPFRNLSIFS